MAGLLIIAHAPLASSLKAVAVHAYPELADTIEVLDVKADASVDQLEPAAWELLERIRDPDAIVFTDVFGATPCNVARRLVDSGHVEAIAGVNVPMLWRALCYAREPLDSLVARAMAGAMQGVLQLDAAPAQSPLPGSG